MSIDSLFNAETQPEVAFGVQIVAELALEDRQAMLAVRAIIV